MNNRYRTIDVRDVWQADVIDPVAPSFYSEASTLGWPVGRCPKIIHTTLGNKRPFLLVRVDRNSDGEALKANYKQSNGTISLIVFND